MIYGFNEVGIICGFVLIGFILAYVSRRLTPDNLLYGASFLVLALVFVGFGMATISVSWSNVTSGTTINLGEASLTALSVLIYFIIGWALVLLLIYISYTIRNRRIKRGSPWLQA